MGKRTTHPSRPAVHVASVVLVTAVAACGGTPAVSSETTPPTTTTPQPTTTQAPTTLTPTTETELIDAGTVTVTETECTLNIASEVSAPGQWEITVVNQADIATGVHLWGPLTGDHPYEDFAEHLEEEVRRTNAGEPPIGHQSWFGQLTSRETLPPGESATLVRTATPGIYGIVCLNETRRVFAYTGPIVVGE